MTQSPESLSLLLRLLSPGSLPAERAALLSTCNESGWASLVSEASRQYVTSLLYLKLRELPQKAAVPPAQLEILRQVYLSDAGRNARSLHFAHMIFSSLARAGVEVIGLKGIYLLENLYGDIGARAMNDIDILVHKADLARALTVLQGLGYRAVTYFSLDDSNLDIKHIPPMARPGSPAVEAHWTLLEEDEPFSIDQQALWQRAKPARIADVDVLGLGIEDLIAHLSLHLTYQHYLKLGLRGLYDIAFLIHQHRDEIYWAKLSKIARDWGAGKVIALTLLLASDLLEVPLPAPAQAALMEWPVPPDVLADAKTQLLGRQSYADYFTPDLVGLVKQKGIFGKVRLGLNRLFLPRRTLARIYGVPPNSIRILGCYFRRFAHLWRQYGATLRKITSGDNSLSPALEDSKVSEALHAWMSR